MKLFNALTPLLVLSLLAAVLLVPVDTATTHAHPSEVGVLAIAGADANIHLYDVATESFTQITTDGDPSSRQYSWPTWSTDGQLAYFGVDILADPIYRLGIFVRPVDGEPSLVFESPSDVFTYAFWSPADCPAGNCRDLAVLYTQGGGGLALRRVRSTGGGTSFDVAEIAEGGPFYWDWSPDGQSMFWARFGEQLELYDVASDSITQTFDESQGLQRAVDWSPVDDRLLTAIPGATLSRSDLLVIDGDERQILVEGMRGLVSYAWSPDATKIAYTNGSAGTLAIIDSMTGEELIAPSDTVLAFFWAPDNQQIAYITPERQGSSTAAKLSAQRLPRLQWNVYDIGADTNRRLGSFVPSREMIYYLNFFDQFIRSHSLWSPDSHLITYGERLNDGTESVNVLDVAEPGRPAMRLMEGGIGIFAW